MPLTAQEIIDATRAVYASCATYRDRGNVRTDFFDPTGAVIKRSEDRPFLTAFRRPDRFRYEFRSDPGVRATRYIVWREGSVVRSRWDLAGDERLESLGLALAGATGVSGGSAHTVPSLLLPEDLEEDALRRFVDFELRGESSIDGTPCHHLTAGMEPIAADVRAQTKAEIRRVTGLDRDFDPEHRPTHLWISIGTGLLRRLERSVHFGTFVTVSVTDYAAAAGVTLGDDEFDFDGIAPILIN